MKCLLWGFLIAASAVVSADALSCYKCIDASNNMECMKNGLVKCLDWQDTCYGKYTVKNMVYFYTKDCIDAATCAQTQKGDGTTAGTTVQTSCCRLDGCNGGGRALGQVTLVALLAAVVVVVASE
ncbi:unnamed protein product [Lampetra planeri]